MPSKEFPIPFPFGGLAKNRGYQSSEPQTTRFSQNVVPDDSGESRTRGGSRPGLTKRYTTSLQGEPQYLVRVSVGDSTRVPEYLVAGTAANVFVGRSIPSGATLPITYTETLNALTGELLTEDDVILETESGVAIIIDEFDLQSINRAVVTQYQGSVILGALDVVVASGTGTGTIDGAASSSTLDDVGVSDWTSLGIDPEIHWVEITSTNAAVFSGTYRIATVTSGNITTVGNVFGAGVTHAAVACDYTIRIGVRRLFPETSSVDLLVPTGGFVPVGADAVCVYRDRVVWGVGRTWYMSRQGDPGDYDYGADPEDPARAIAGNASEAGQPADPIVAMAAAGFDYLIIFAENSTWVMRGDPGYGGQLYPASRTIGCIGSKAWCYGNETEIYFLAKDGLYMMPPNAGGVETLSHQLLPRELRFLDRDNFYITLAYDPEDHGVLIFAVPKTGGAGSHYWFDIETTSFWPVQFSSSSHQPTDAVTFGGAPTRPRRIVMACYDGFIREYTGTSDDGIDITSTIVLGPFPMTGEQDIDGILTEIVCTIDAQSVPVTMKVFFGRSAEDATYQSISGSPDWTATVHPVRSWTLRPRRRGNSFCVRIDAVGVWAFESLFAKLSVAGKTRR